MKTHKNPKSNLSKKVFELTEGVASRLTDMVLIMLYYGFEAAFSSRGDLWQAGEKVVGDFEYLNSNSIKNALKGLKKQGFIGNKGSSENISVITETGRKKLNATIPFYDNKRTWDKHVYLVTYDLPVSKNNQRNYLRTYLRTIGCGMLQESVWVTPYNPTKLIDEFVTDSFLEDSMILVSSFGNDGAIGDMDLRSLMDKVFKLSEINKRYRDFLHRTNNGGFTKEQLMFGYLAILKDDPQIPFELLPGDWLGGKANQVFLEKIKQG
ncbi:MAG TPA: PaaX family transcriptional regulator C-terminal domain-containing protein [Patescibacteria group bacterium]|nr:PaaX family transcriptional regulator C-terminal domain-containing protein [Patescibacteria group bacterium]